jgi:hypothetical protein
MGASGSKHKIEPVLAEVDHALTEVRYVKEYPQVDFFRSIGKLVMPVLMRDWYMDGAGRVSRCADGVSNETEEWRTDYWRRFEASASQKLEDWRHESEYRLIWPRLGGYDHNETERLATYPFETLRGLIFGINTSHSDKMAIMEIIEAKCRLHKREDFEFAQAEYDDREGRIGIYPFGLLKPYVP